MAKSEKIKDVPVLSSLNGTEKIPTGGRGKFTTTITQISDYISGALVSLINNKVDKVTGKGLSTEDYTTVEKMKLDGIEQGAEVNVNADWNSTSGDSEILNKPDLLQLGETDTTAYRGDRGKVAYDHTLITTGNPHQVTKAEVDLGNADNTSDVDKPISTAQQVAFDTKLEELASPSVTGTALNLTKSGVLGRLKKLAVNTTTDNLTIIDNTDHVVLDTNGDSLKFFKEEQNNGDIALYQRNIPTGASNVYLSGRHSADNLILNGTGDGFYPSFSLFNPKHSQKISHALGSGAIDLQILRRTDLTDSVSVNSFTLGGFNSTSSAGSYSIGWNINTGGARSGTINSGYSRVNNNGANTLLISSTLSTSTPTNNSTPGTYPVTSSANSSLIINRGTAPFGGTSGGNYAGSHHLIISGGGSIGGNFNTVFTQSTTSVSGTSNLIFGNASSVTNDRSMQNAYILSLRPAFNNQTAGGNSIVKLPLRAIIFSSQANNFYYMTATEDGSQGNLTTTTYKMGPTNSHDSLLVEAVIKVYYHLTNSVDIVRLTGTVCKNGTNRILNYTLTNILQTITPGTYDIDLVLEATDYVRTRIRWNGSNFTPYSLVISTESYTTYTELGV